MATRICNCGRCGICIQRFQRHMAQHQYEKEQNNLYYVNANGCWTNYDITQGRPGVPGPMGAAGPGGPLYQAKLWTRGDNNFYINYANTRPSAPTGLPNNPDLNANSIFPFTNGESYGIELSSSSSSNFYWFGNSLPDVKAPITGESLYDGFILPKNGVYQLSYTLCSVWPYPVQNVPAMYPYINNNNNIYTGIYTDANSTLSTRVLINDQPCPGSAKTVYNETNSNYLKNKGSTTWTSFPSLSNTVIFHGKQNDIVKLANNNGIRPLYVYNTYPYVFDRYMNSGQFNGNQVSLDTTNLLNNSHTIYIAVYVESNQTPSLSIADNKGNTYSLVSSINILNSTPGITNYLYVYYKDYSFDATSNTSIGVSTITITNTSPFADMHGNYLILANTNTSSKGAVTINNGNGTSAGSVLNVQDVNNAVLVYVLTNGNPSDVLPPGPVPYSIYYIYKGLLTAIYYPTSITNQQAIISFTPSLSWKSVCIEVNVGYYPLFIDTPTSVSMNIKMLYSTTTA